MKTTAVNPVKAFTLVALGLAIAAMGLYVANADDAPGAAVTFDITPDGTRIVFDRLRENSDIVLIDLAK